MARRATKLRTCRPGAHSQLLLQAEAVEAADPAGPQSLTATVAWPQTSPLGSGHWTASISLPRLGDRNPDPYVANCSETRVAHLCEAVRP